MKEKKLSSEYIGLFCEQMAMLLEAGIPIQEGIEIILEETDEKGIKDLLTKLKEEIIKYNALSKALEQIGIFPTYMVEMVKIGEESGKTDSVMRKLSMYYQKEEELKRMLKKAVGYPIVLFAMMCSIMVVIATKVLPVFEQILENLGSQLSGIGMRMMMIGMGISKYSMSVLAIIIIGIVIIFIAIKFKHKIPAVRKVSEKINLYQLVTLQRFSEAMAITLSSGSDIAEALKLGLMLVQHRGIYQKIETAMIKIQKGEAFAQILKEEEIYGKMDTYFLIIGIKMGQLDETMQKIADQQTEKIENTVLKTIEIIEPTVVILLSVTIGSILISVMFPLMGIISAIG